MRVKEEPDAQAVQAVATVAAAAAAMQGDVERARFLQVTHAGVLAEVCASPPIGYAAGGSSHAGQELLQQPPPAAAVGEGEPACR